MGGTTPPTYLHDYLEYTQDIWYGFSKNIKVDFLGSEISALDPKILREILYKLTEKAR